ncbi:MAG: LLM class F420-dependent oxidoreductase [Acidimicrobiia bacterium]|nr:LLM class F420-dependent oxidoreductase [Acidimicrobiia bacterium]
MRIWIYGGDVVGRGIDEVVEAARTAEEQGFHGFALPQIFGLDAITTLALVGREVPRIELVTSVVPVYTHHPVALAQAARTAQAASGGRFVLGLGLSHPWVIENVLGLSFEQPVRYLREHLSVLLPLVREGSVEFRGETVAAQATVDVPGSTPCPVLVAALGPRMLALTGEMADGTVTWMTGPRTLESHTVPAITASAERAGRPAPRVAAGFPVCVSDDPDAARDRAARIYRAYGALPSYRAMLDREGVEGPGDVAVVGDEAEVERQIRHLADVGVTDFAAAEYGRPEERARTRALLRSLL